MNEQSGTRAIVSLLWKECKTLQSAGVSYHNYVSELTLLLFLKMMEETQEEQRMPDRFRWSHLSSISGPDQLSYYRRLLFDLGDPKKTDDPLVLEIFADAHTQIRTSQDLKSLTDTIDSIDWFSKSTDGLGDVYEGLLEKTTSATKSKAGQYFTPRPLIDSIVRVIQPQPTEVVQDPAAGTGGFPYCG